MLTSCVCIVGGILWIAGEGAQFCSQEPWWYGLTTIVLHVAANLDEDECSFSCYGLVDVRRRTTYSKSCCYLRHRLQCLLWIQVSIMQTELHCLSQVTFHSWGPVPWLYPPEVRCHHLR
jgi:hypothetical protein